MHFDKMKSVPFHVKKRQKQQRFQELKSTQEQIGKGIEGGLLLSLSDALSELSTAKKSGLGKIWENLVFLKNKLEKGFNCFIVTLSCAESSPLPPPK